MAGEKIIAAKGLELPSSVIAGHFGLRVPEPLRGAMRLLQSLGHATLAEFPLRSGRRADILSLDASGAIWIVEVKSGVPDFRSDRKWRSYREWCDGFSFAVGPDFPLDLLPEDAGIIVADAYDGVLLREPQIAAIASSRRKSLTLRFAHLAARRLSNLPAERTRTLA